MQMNPLVILLSVLIGTSLDGIAGVLLAVPVMAIVQIVFLRLIVPLLRGELRLEEVVEKGGDTPNPLKGAGLLGASHRPAVGSWSVAIPGSLAPAVSSCAGRNARTPISLSFSWPVP